jgi:hypothetical protein
MIGHVLEVQPGAAFDKQPHHVGVVGPHGLVQRR